MVDVSRRIRISMRASMCKALADIGAEPVDGSGFEDEEPDLDFTESETARASLPQAEQCE